MTTENKTAADLAAKIPARIRLLADDAKEKAVFDDKNNATVPKDYWTNHAPDGVTIDSYQKHVGFMADLNAAGSLALGELSIPLMQADEDLKKTTMVIPLDGKDHIAASFTRSQTIGENTVHGVVRSSHEVYISKSVGAMAAVKDVLAEGAKAVFAKL